ncbi:MFS transporter [Xenorhabdus szentirmaii]|uniref:MFS transporter n=1 Tax=Xenorhabdus szentirmaii TaxID=290112 RepID=UPI0019BA14AC|nr:MULTISPECIES: MFS transporter [unclassified Xenorhabdus]MBD2781403.1 MFS transporter [Xenorhabdus sp. 38]MBD2791524.1 MFS transporter [Xenorhabdus sp. CUL]MBD2824678.1 MFS transporter [Xenorhabdus sp. 5]
MGRFSLCWISVLYYYWLYQLNVTPTQVGFLVSIYAIVVAVTGPFITLMLSGYNKKYILLSILLVFIISNLIYAITDVFYLMLMFRIFPGLVHAVFFAVALVVVANSVPEEKSANAKVFAGVAVGMVLGMPMSSFVAENLSLSAAFYFGASICTLAFIGIFVFMPSMPVTKNVTFISQLNVLRKGKLWLSMTTVSLIFSAMFSSFSYIADYLTKVTHLDNNLVSAILILFGCCGLIGNFAFSRSLQKSVLKTTFVYPMLLIFIYVQVWLLGFSLIAMCVLIIFWGGLHSEGLVVSQTWLMQEADEAPEFANSLYIAFSNLGITIGAMTGGWFLSQFGVSAVMWSSILFAFMALLTIYMKSAIYQNRIVY